MPTYRITFKDAPVPCREDVQTLLEDFVAGPREIIWVFDAKHLRISLMGTMSHPERRLNDHGRDAHELIFERKGKPRERCIYVHAEEVAYVISGDMDPFTQAVSHGIALQLAETWGGTYDPPK